MILKCLPVMIKSDTYTSLEFFDSAIFQPLTMQEPVIINWPIEE